MRTHGMDTLWPEAGKRYCLRNGMITGVMVEDPDLASIGHPDRFHTEELVDGFFAMWRSNGRSTFFTQWGDDHGGDDHGGFDKDGNEIITIGTSMYDIIEEYTE